MLEKAKCMDWNIALGMTWFILCVILLFLTPDVILLSFMNGNINWQFDYKMLLEAIPMMLVAKP